MNKQQYYILSGISFLAGVLLLCLYQEIIIIRLPHQMDYATNVKRATKKPVTFWAWHNNQWHHESYELIWPQDKTEQIQRLVNTWLTYLHEEQYMTKKVSVQSVLLATGNTLAYISCDRNPFGKEQAIHTKWYFVEGLLKTLKENSLALQEVQLLVNHRPITDPHLALNRPWPIQGFTQAP